VSGGASREQLLTTSVLPAGGVAGVLALLTYLFLASNNLV
jgi:hypothetical protein